MMLVLIMMSTVMMMTLSRVTMVMMMMVMIMMSTVTMMTLIMMMMVMTMKHLNKVNHLSISVTFLQHLNCHSDRLSEWQHDDDELFEAL